MEIGAGHHVWLRIRDPWVECPLRVVARAIHADTSATWRIAAHLWQVDAMRLPSFTCGVACLLMLPEGQATAVPDTMIKVILLRLKRFLYSFHYSLRLTFLQLLYFLRFPFHLLFLRLFFIWILLLFWFVIYWHVLYCIVLYCGRVPAANAPGCTAAEGLLYKPWSSVVPTYTARCLHQRP